MKLNSLRDLYVGELKDLYDAESRLSKALPKMSKAAASPELRTAFDHHLEETRMHTDRLGRIFERMGESPKGGKCKGIEAIIDEGEDVMEHDAPAAVSDAALISAAQRLEHYEIAAYGTAHTFARRLCLDHDARLLEETLREEKEADKKLTTLAESYINEEAKSAR